MTWGMIAAIAGKQGIGMKTKHVLRLAMLAAALPLMASSRAAAAPHAPYCHWEITVLDGKTREQRTFQAGARAFEIPLTGLPGFRTCKVLPERLTELYGQAVSRVEVYCYTSSGDAMMTQGAVTPATVGEVTRFQLLARPVAVTVGDNQATVNAGGFREFTLQCKP
jgi:hypothetical protein